MTLISGLPYARQANLLFHGHRGLPTRCRLWTRPPPASFPHTQMQTAARKGRGSDRKTASQAMAGKAGSAGGSQTLTSCGQAATPCLASSLSDSDASMPTTPAHTSILHRTGDEPPQGNTSHPLLFCMAPLALLPPCISAHGQHQPSVEGYAGGRPGLPANTRGTPATHPLHDGPPTHAGTVRGDKQRLPPLAWPDAVLSAPPPFS